MARLYRNRPDASVLISSTRELGLDASYRPCTVCHGRRLIERAIVPGCVNANPEILQLCPNVDMLPRTETVPCPRCR